jgi:hypothetical protein
MKQKIEGLIEQYQTDRIEIWNILEELNQINTTKLNYKENDSLREHKIKLSEEYDMRGLFITDLKNLL